MMRMYTAACLAMMLIAPGTHAESQDNDTAAKQFMAYCERELNVTKNYEEAAKICKRVRLDVKVLVGQSPLYLRSIINEADVKWALGNYPEAFNLYSEAAEVAIALGDVDKVRELRIRQAEAEMFRGKSFEAEILLRDAINRVRSSGGNSGLHEAELLLKHADVLVTLNQIKPAIEDYLAAFTKLDPNSAAHRPTLLKLQLHYAEVFERQSRYVGAVATYQRLLTLASAAPADNFYVAIACERLGWISETLRKPQEAAAFYRRQLEVVEKTVDQAGKAGALRRKIQELEG